MLSMTGYGKGGYEEGGVELAVEIKTVNNRYLDVSIKAPRVFSAYEENIRGEVRAMLTRGHADVFVSFTDKREKEKKITLDENAARAYMAAAERVKELFPQIADDVTVTSVMRFPDVIKQEEAAAADEILVSAAEKALKEALSNLNAMRLREGEKLKADMLSRMDVIEGLVACVEKRAPLVAEEYRVRLETKIKKILASEQPDEGRILTEAALFADRSNIDEELTRLGSHIAQFRAICKEDIVGRKLDFLVQEFNRETNTICSKSNDLEITRLGLALKNEIEKIREQVQNVE